MKNQRNKYEYYFIGFLQVLQMQKLNFFDSQKTN